jgi:hypothetical protein
LQQQQRRQRAIGSQDLLHPLPMHSLSLSLVRHCHASPAAASILPFVQSNGQAICDNDLRILC